ncbi:1,5-anhydro-D-fructose reductase [Jeotgalibaca dankookensis]|uniref:1,5-anhydro-D-fructose reductase n=1 Tax=Jeotgalibaca dankookensis TaxID=708126 RepID=A0A1S6IM58_9LACT|nr:Gfo/Idh/MocA family oxidoreductase [Jeotgalibaca dankookensis]AQS52599.1 1,5-anhydro-D-fructose reductase [Jeotgalibaca dankookensis]
MLNVGIIGTSGIAHEFAKALQMTEDYQVKAIYSRTKSKAQSFGEAYGADLFFDDLEEMLARPEIDVIYIASPNSLHFQQAMSALDHHKHVIVEKPAFSNLSEWDQAFARAEEAGVKLFEAARHLHDRNFQVAKDQIKKFDKIDNAVLSYGKYSSRYDQVLDGQEPNIFSLKYSGGALMDLGVYLLYAAIGWFGEPESATYQMKKVSTGVDGSGVILFQYPTFNVTMHVSKTFNLHVSNEINNGHQTIILDELTGTKEIILENTRTNERTDLAYQPDAHLMLAEALAFAREINRPSDDYEEWKQLSRKVTAWSEKLRKEAGIYFTADK